MRFGDGRLYTFEIADSVKRNPSYVFDFVKLEVELSTATSQHPSFSLVPRSKNIQKRHNFGQEITCISVHTDISSRAEIAGMISFRPILAPINQSERDMRAGGAGLVLI